MSSIDLAPLYAKYPPLKCIVYYFRECPRNHVIGGKQKYVQGSAQVPYFNGCHIESPASEAARVVSEF